MGISALTLKCTISQPQEAKFRSFVLCKGWQTGGWRFTANVSRNCPVMSAETVRNVLFLCRKTPEGYTMKGKITI